MRIEASSNNKKASEIIAQLEQAQRMRFDEFERIELELQRRVLSAFAKHRVTPQHFAPSNGYGYNDIGRDCLDKLFADAIEAEAAIVSPSIASGTHAIFLAISGLVRNGEAILSISGKPYDTLLEALGIQGTADCSLKESGIRYHQIELTKQGGLDIDAITATASELLPRVVYLQRSRGYAWRNSILPEDMKEAFDAVHSVCPDAVIVVDNCYGEFTRLHEPSYYGADIIVGSLIKNAGGGLAPTGGYIAGKREYVERIACKLTVPGIGREIGSYAASYLPFYQGLFNAPHSVCQCLKTAVLFAALFERLGLLSMPLACHERSDIVQALRFNSKQALINFCRCIQSISPIDSFVSPEPWAMPGYEHEVIMAAGTFVQGATSELSADAPITEPYTAYMQGALTYAHGRLAAERVLAMLLEE